MFLKGKGIQENENKTYGIFRTYQENAFVCKVTTFLQQGQIKILV